MGGPETGRGKPEADTVFLAEIPDESRSHETDGIPERRGDELAHVSQDYRDWMRYSSNSVVYPRPSWHLLGRWSLKHLTVEYWFIRLLTLLLYTYASLYSQDITEASKCIKSCLSMRPSVQYLALPFQIGIVSAVPTPESECIY